MPAGRLSLIVNSYEQPDYLSRVLRAVREQSRPPDELLLADDGSGEETRRVWRAATQDNPFRCEHVWQEHQGFRRARILNQAIARSTGDYLVFLDGDTVPHPEFMADHHGAAAERRFVQGHRALVERRAAAYFGTGSFVRDRRRALFTGQLRGWKHAYRWPWGLTRVRQDLRGIRGCNLGIWRADLVAVNGYNEAFVGWGREDSELVVRLYAGGVRRLDLRGRALCYHLWHPPASREGLADNDARLEEARRENRPRCAAGLDQHVH